MSDYIVGIDIGSSKVCTAVGRVDRQGKMQIVGITSVPCSGLKKGVVVDIDNTSDSIKNCIEQLERMVDTHIDSVYICLPGGISELIPSKGVVAVSSDDREIKSSDVERVIKAAKVVAIPSDKAIIGIIPEQFIVDGYENIKDPIGMSGLRLEVDAQLIAAQTTIVNNICKSVTKAGLNIQGIVLEPVAISQVVLTKEEMSLGTALIDVGAETIDISIYKGGNLIHTDMIPLGGSTITNDISICLKISATEAEKLKIKYGSVEKTVKPYDEKISVNAGYNSVVQVDYNMLTEIIQARVEELFYFIYKKLKESNNYDEISGVVVVGGGISLFKGISEIGQEILNKPIRIGIPEYVGASSPTYAAAVGVIKDTVSSLKLTNSTESNSELSVKGSLVANKEKEDTSEGSSVITKIKNFFVEFF
jgi:cell division protein FtsA